MLTAVRHTVLHTESHVDQPRAANVANVGYMHVLSRVDMHHGTDGLVPFRLGTSSKLRFKLSRTNRAATNERALVVSGTSESRVDHSTSKQGLPRTCCRGSSTLPGESGVLVTNSSQGAQTFTNMLTAVGGLHCVRPSRCAALKQRSWNRSRRVRLKLQN